MNVIAQPQCHLTIDHNSCTLHTHCDLNFNMNNCTTSMPFYNQLQLLHTPHLSNTSFYGDLSIFWNADVRLPIVNDDVTDDVTDGVSFANDVVCLSWNVARCSSRLGNTGNRSNICLEVCRKLSLCWRRHLARLLENHTWNRNERSDKDKRQHAFPNMGRFQNNVIKTPRKLLDN